MPALQTKVTSEQSSTYNVHSRRESEDGQRLGQKFMRAKAERPEAVPDLRQFAVVRPAKAKSRNFMEKGDSIVLKYRTGRD